jgi:hypothetical protein
MLRSFKGKSCYSAGLFLGPGYKYMEWYKQKDSHKVAANKTYLRWQDIHWTSSRYKCSIKNILLKIKFAA